MIVDIARLISDLEVLTPGLGKTNGYIPEDNCFVFWNGEAVTFNGELLCHKKTHLRVTGAFWAPDMLKHLRCLRKGRLAVTETERFIRFDSQPKPTVIPKWDGEIVTTADFRPQPTGWNRLPLEVVEALEICSRWIQRSRHLIPEITQFHIFPDKIVAVHFGHLMEFRIKTGFDTLCSIRANKWMRISRRIPDQYSVSDGCIHFLSRCGLMTACVLDEDFFLDWKLPPTLPFKGYLIQFPGEARKACELAGLFAPGKSRNKKIMGAINNPLTFERFRLIVTVNLSENKMKIKGKGPGCWYQEELPVRYKGPPFEFSIDPDLLLWIITEHAEALISPDLQMLKVVRSNWEYSLQLKLPGSPAG